MPKKTIRVGDKKRVGRVTGNTGIYLALVYYTNQILYSLKTC